MTQYHEPWYLNENDLVGGWCIGTVKGSLSDTRGAADVADMIVSQEVGERIVACINACRWIPTDQLEGVMQDLRDMLGVNEGE